MKGTECNEGNLILSGGVFHLFEGKYELSIVISELSDGISELSDGKYELSIVISELSDGIS